MGIHRLEKKKIREEIQEFSLENLATDRSGSNLKLLYAELYRTLKILRSQPPQNS